VAIEDSAISNLFVSGAVTKAEKSAVKVNPHSICMHIHCYDISIGLTSTSSLNVTIRWRVLVKVSSKLPLAQSYTCKRDTTMNRNVDTKVVWG